VVNLLARALVEILRHALLEARHAFGEHRLAVTGQLLLGIEKVETIGRVEIASAATACQRTRKRDEDGSCDQTLRAAHTGFPNSFCRYQLLATGGSKACSASARERRLGGVSPSLAIRSSHCRVAAASLARQADSASNSRAVWRKVAPGAADASRRSFILG